MRLSNRLYDCLKWVVTIVLPAVATLLSVLNGAWEWGWPIEAILTTFSGGEAFLGALLGISTISYQRDINCTDDAEDASDDI